VTLARDKKKTLARTRGGQKSSTESHCFECSIGQEYSKCSAAFFVQHEPNMTALTVKDTELNAFFVNWHKNVEILHLTTGKTEAVF